ncbi:type VII secretion protein EccC [Ilumatobacter coccineus]|uniref:FtsK domain-containing protein n=1 Tax=Ilumatobacter coccineus (strain NBRC 103263 / KCTC 29153 / YM16-304) TaxID=1313172 RepID=A0A6C7EGH3_ILUCY|nr:hypothetical protein [Ilumatobacter coccineus]BAN04229.1 hypothetical protein YM304_39150 [Ilumatobacter coccineus YM16-304]
MDVVVRTPHGDADIDIVSAPGTTTLGDLITAVTGQAPPAVARVDDRTVNASQTLTSLGLMVGSVIDANAPDPHDTKPDDVRVNLQQLTGRGAGSIRSLSSGRFRIGPGRRLNASEMIEAPVETEAFEIDVQRNGSVEVTPGPRVGGALGVMTPTLDQKLFDRELPWTSGRLSVGGRLFELENPALAPPRRTLPDPDHRGAVPFQRQPRIAGIPELLAVSAKRRAASAGQGLWARRRTDPGAYTLPFGILPDDHTVAVVDFLRHRGAALVGSDRFGAGLARTLLVEAATQYGPSDLEIVIASTPERLGQWDWAKWLPHLRHGDPSAPPALFAERLDLETWAASITGRPQVDAFSARREAAAASDDGTPNRWTAPSSVTAAAVTTLLVLDDISLWSRRDSPLRNVLVDPPAHLRIIALCGGMHEAPGMCSALVEERLPVDVVADAGDDLGSTSLYGSLATLHLRIGQSPEEVSDIRPAFVEPVLATEIARSLAPLDDLDVTRPPQIPTRFAPPSLAELIDIQAATDAQANGLTVALGLVEQSGPAGIGSVVAERRPVRVDLAESRVTLVSAPDRETHDTLVAAAILGATAVRRTEQLSVLTVGSRRPSWHGEIPHIAGHVDRSTPDDPARLVHRVAHVLTQQPGLEVLVVIEDAFTTPQPSGSDDRVVPNSLLTGMLELAESLSRVHLLITTEHPVASLPDSIRNRCGITIDVGGSADEPRGTVTSEHAEVRFVAPTRLGGPSELDVTPILDANALLIRPCVHGRAMTPLERRVGRSAPRAASSDQYDPATQQIAQRIAAETTTLDDGSGLPEGGLLPPPLPTSVDLGSLLATHDGDGIPLGLLDRPEQADNEAYWWAPGPHGSLLAIGSPRSGMTQLADLLAVGIAARLSTDDLRVFVIEPLPQRRRAYDALPHTVAAVSTDEHHAAQRVVSTVAELLEMRRSGELAEEAAVLLVIGDLARLIRWLPDDQRDDVLETLATIGSDGPALGVNLVCITTRVDDLGPLVRLSGDRLVGTVSEASDRTRLGVPAPGPADRHPGRCWSADADRRLQLATPPDSVEHEVARLAPEMGAEPRAAAAHERRPG